MEAWIVDEIRKVDRKTVKIIPTDYFLMKNIPLWENPYIEKTIRYGKPYPQKSTYSELSICFKLYFKEIHKTYFVVVIIHKNFIKIITRYDKNGRH